jgi:MFS family permease
VSWLDDFIAGPSHPGEVDPDARPNRRLLWVDGLISNVRSHLLRFVNPFAMTLGATNGQIGALSAVASLASAFGLLPGARLSERSGQRKLIVVLTGGLAGRLLLLGLALLPLFLGSPAVIYAAIACLALRPSSTNSYPPGQPLSPTWCRDAGATSVPETSGSASRRWSSPR